MLHVLNKVIDRLIGHAGTQQNLNMMDMKCTLYIDSAFKQRSQVFFEKLARTACFQLFQSVC